jgi:hypothetical protein
VDAAEQCATVRLTAAFRTTGLIATLDPPPAI